MHHDFPGAPSSSGAGERPVHGPAPQEGGAHPSLNRTALSTTLHCLSGCSLGEALGMAIGTALGWGNAATIVLAVVLAFLFGY